MKNIPMAEKFFEEYDLSEAPIEYSSEEGWAYLAGKRDSYKKAIEFAKLHVEAALKEASENAETKYVKYTENDYTVDKESILNAYPLTKII